MPILKIRTKSTNIYCANLFNKQFLWCYTPREETSWCMRPCIICDFQMLSNVKHYMVLFKMIHNVESGAREITSYRIPVDC